MNKHLFSAFIIIIFSVSAKSQTNVSGNITQNTTWIKAGSPYTLTGNVTVSAGATLTIEAGTVVQRNTNLYQMFINGSLQCNGLATDSIVFAASEGQAFGAGYFLEFQKSDLSGSVLKYVSIQNNNGSNSFVRVGNEGVLTQTNPKNSGVLTISHSTLNHAYMATNGYQTSAGLAIDSSFLNDAYFTQSINSEGISFSNTQILNSFISSVAYGRVISYTNCALNNVDMYQICCDVDYAFINSTVENSKLGDQSTTSNNDSVTILNSSFVNTPVYNDRGFIRAVNSSFIYTDKVVDRDSSQSHTQLIASGGMVRDCRFQNTSSYDVNGVALAGLSNTPYTDTVTRNHFYNTFGGILLNNVVSVRCDSNYFSSTTGYDLYNIGTTDIYAPNNYFTITTGQTIDDVIFDKNDYASVGYIFYTPYLTDSAVLPLKLINFAGTGKENTVALTWQTSNEINTSAFIIQRKTGNTFIHIGSLTTLNTTNGAAYSFTDASPVAGNNYYRLKIVDKDGKYAYSAIVQVAFDNIVKAWRVYPNPASTYIVIEYSAVNNDTQMQLTNAAGSVVKTITAVRGSTQTKMTINGVAKGTYKIVLKDGTRTESKTVLIH